MNTNRRFFNGALVLVGLTAGCADPDGGLNSRSASDRGTRAILAAAGASEITMFGDIRAGFVPTYSARHTVSLIQHTFTEVGSDLDADVDSIGQRLVFSSTRHSTNPNLYIKNVDGLAVMQLTTDPASDVQPAFSPDGEQIAFASNRSGNWDIWIAGVNGGGPIQLTSGRADEIHPSWSPDGSQIVFCSLPARGGEWELWVADTRSGFTKRFVGYGLFPEWSPIGDTIVYQRARERGSRWFSIWTVTLENGEPGFPSEVAAGASHAMVLPTWSPDGTAIAYSAIETASLGPSAIGQPISPRLGVFDLWLMNADGRAKVRLTDGQSSSFGPTFAPNGRIFFTSSRIGYENIWSILPGAMPASSTASNVALSDLPVVATTTPNTAVSLGKEGH